MGERLELSIFVDEGEESQRAHLFVRERLSPYYDCEFIPASGHKLPALEIKGDPAVFCWGERFWKYISQLETIAKKKEGKKNN